MAISREEIEQIAREVADKVVSTAKGCRCGVATWDAQTSIHSIEAGITHQQPTWVLPDIELLGRVLKVVEEDCGTNLTEAREIAERIKVSVEKKDWQEARRNTGLLKSSISVSLIECAEEGSEQHSGYILLGSFQPKEYIEKAIGSKAPDAYAIYQIIHRQPGMSEPEIKGRAKAIDISPVRVERALTELTWYGYITKA